MTNTLPPIHPGQTIKQDVLKRLNLSVNRLAKALSVDAARLNDIARGPEEHHR
jgi:addiction module HigA family antidote